MRYRHHRVRGEHDRLAFDLAARVPQPHTLAVLTGPPHGGTERQRQPGFAPRTSHHPSTGAPTEWPTPRFALVSWSLARLPFAEYPTQRCALMPFVW